MPNHKQISLQLYSTTHCHLCEKASNLLVEIERNQSITWQFVEITEDEKLLFEYELKIPVLKRLDNNAELLWPFTYQEVLMFID